MEIRQLEYFVAVFDGGSLSRAAKTLMMSQPALTRQIQQLEKECEAALFNRVSTGIVPTAAGNRLYQHAVSLIRGIAAARDSARDAGPVREIVEIGLAPGLPPTWLDEVIECIQAAVPRASLTLTDANSTNQLTLVRTGRIDIGLVHEPPPPELFAHRVLREPFGVALSPAAHSRIDTDEGCSISILDGLDVLAHSRDQVPMGHDQLVSAAFAAEIRPRWHFANYIENAHACAKATGSQAAILTAPSARRLLPMWTWRVLNDPPITMQTWIVRQHSARATIVEVVDAVMTSFQSTRLDVGVDYR